MRLFLLVGCMEGKKKCALAGNGVVMLLLNYKRKGKKKCALVGDGVAMLLLNYKYVVTKSVLYRSGRL